MNLRPPGPQPEGPTRRCVRVQSPPSPLSPSDGVWDASDTAVGTKAVPRPVNLDDRPTGLTGAMERDGSNLIVGYRERLAKAYEEPQSIS